MDIPVYQVDAFTDKAFAGNPAAVCPLTEWLPDATMQAIAFENNLSETAFCVSRGAGEYELRWFTPAAEVDLCGHATLASASVLFGPLGEIAPAISFHTRSGELRVSRREDLLVMDFPALPAEPVTMPEGLVEALGAEPSTFLRAVKNMAVFETEAQVRAINPDFNYIAAMDGMGLIITAPGDNIDCASRYFAPQVGVNEDPVTGSAHCTIVPYWADRLGKTDIHARQVSARSGDLYCRYLGERVEMAGHAVLVLSGKLWLP
ncbi:MAG: PhzF family phenazine biosynthesis protein [Rhodospirillaceae bacterium]|jgi:PhzF family phenazine biosynthesis protein|nr:PhzF family phenazine biosynthesis protein [Rhodospirillaceae bacterium]